jgi:hypothetical protein
VPAASHFKYVRWDERPAGDSLIRRAMLLFFLFFDQEKGRAHIRSTMYPLLAVCAGRRDRKGLPAIETESRQGLFELDGERCFYLYLPDPHQIPHLGLIRHRSCRFDCLRAQGNAFSRRGESV